MNRSTKITLKMYRDSDTLSQKLEECHQYCLENNMKYQWQDVHQRLYIDFHATVCEVSTPDAASITRLALADVEHKEIAAVWNAELDRRRKAATDSWEVWTSYGNTKPYGMEYPNG